MYRVLLVVFATLAAVNAVTITNYANRNCGGSARSCSNIGEGRCCYRQGSTFASSKFSGLINSELGAVCSGTANAQCKTIRKASPGNGCINPPGPTQRLKGSYWLNCIIRRKRANCPSVESKEALAQLEGTESQTGEQVLPDKVIFDGHVFNINYHVPSNVTEALEYLADGDARYDDVPEDLKQFEVTGDAAKEYLESP
ncbi:hypothetical protein ASPZODRAFT_136084 [Penicilliopsis zonata CBS 506.65]|uniref:Hydrophobin n=1 Tax=Penicilliopsis zonata CBS 506.65 TaxID=1073090 RepID=A0A1L9S8Z6_9EURO|nr:hypothetical protein ASPZODRAFT_136084 [Penicilliopsis zonata CBS 506.65]OJJ43633.1 hypothetical protein ASPZODRAFT_136084 [Penicilliopsis zonata CBS 506.65]